MSSAILNPKIKSYKSQVDDAVKDLHELASRIGHRDLSATVGELRNRLGEPYMFVVCGEVKAGKSSFINALLDSDSQGREICKVAPQPMTDTIQQIIFGEKAETTTINPLLKRVAVPVEILKEIAVVDTPGTNSIADGHQEVTERFIPASDLVVFVFECKNPYHRSAWDFFELIHGEWRKKIVFVLQQKDLMSPEDLAINERGLREYAQKRGVEEPIIFSVSAKNELEGKYDLSGFSSFRDFIRSHVTGGRAAAMKLQNSVSTSKNILERIEKDLALRKEQFRQDAFFRDDIRDTLEKQEVKSLKQADFLIENLTAGYDRITRRTGEELEASLSFFGLLRRSISGIFGKQASLKDHLDELAKNLEVQLNAELKSKLSDGVVDLADSVQQMAKMIDLKIQSSKSVARPDAYLFDEISSNRASVLKDLQADFARFMSRSENFADEKLFASTHAVSPNIAAGSGVAIIGAVLALVTNVTALDITGGVLTGIGLLFAGLTAGTQKKKVIDGFWAEIEKGRRSMSEALETKLRAYVKTIKGRIGQNFLELDAMLENEAREIENIDAAYASIDNRLENLDKELAAF